MASSLTSAQIKEANTIVTNMMATLRKALPDNEHLVALSVQLKTMLAANPERIHDLIGNYVVRPHREEIRSANDAFISKLHEESGDLLGLGSCYFSLGIEDRGAILYGLILLSNIL
jgi:hypothetical protein